MLFVKKHQDYPIKCGFLRAWICEVGSGDTGNVRVVFRNCLLILHYFSNHAPTSINPSLQMHCVTIKQRVN
jgi:hypothetical protein